MAGAKKKEKYTYVKECVDCGSKHIKAYHTYSAADGSVRRYRKCLDCDYHFTTIEMEECVSDVSGLLDDINALKEKNARLTQLTEECVIPSITTQEELCDIFGENIKKLCKKKRMTIHALERKMGVHVGYMAQSCKKRHNVGIWTVYRASVVLEVPISRLLTKGE